MRCQAATVALLVAPALAVMAVVALPPALAVFICSFHDSFTL